MTRLKNRGGDVLVWRLTPAGPDAVRVLAEVYQLFTDNVGASAVGQPGRIAHDGVDALFGDDGWPHHVAEVVGPDVVSVDSL